MDTTVVQYEFKLKKLLNKFLEPGYRLGNDVYLNILLSHLSGKNNPEQAEQLRQLPIFTEWLETAVTQWETTMDSPSPSIATFTLNLASLISLNELSFTKLNISNIYLRLCKVLKLRSNEISPSVKLGYLKMLHSFMNHSSGLDWIVATDHWNDILIYCLENQTIYITRDGYNFMFDLLSKFVEVHPTFCELVVKKITMKLEPEEFNKNGSVRSEIDDVQIQKDLMPTLKLVIFILEKSYLSEIQHESEKIPQIFIHKYNLESTLWKLLMVARDHDLIFNISKSLKIINFALADKVELESVDTCMPILTTFCKKFYELYNNLINKRSPVNVLKLCYLGHIYWKRLRINIPSCEATKEPLLYENQLIIFQIMPILYITFSCIKGNIQEDDLTETFILKLFDISCQHTIRYAYAYRSLLMTYDLTNAFDFGQKAIFYLMKTREHLNRPRAVIVFQSMMYAFRFLIKSFKDKTQSIDLLTYHTGFISALLDGLSNLIKDFKITWRESVETICLLSITLDLLNLPNLPTKLTVEALKVMHLTVANFMPPNLALLVNEVDDTSLSDITPMLYKKLHDINWEIRDSALEILYTMVDIAHLKFPAFQKMIVDDHLCQLSVVLTTDDSESFVRASAIKCITAMVQVPAFWCSNLEYEQLPEKMMTILQTESEAIVRCEATKLICEIYEHQYIPSDLTTKLYTSMSSAAISDLHWEVKVNALNFWDKVINNEMSNQGMIDGVFPSVTFSKEHKKIVTLTEPEIQNRLNKVLLNLSECGCLAVLLDAMHDDCDLQVTKKSVEITKKLTELLKKYNSLNSTAVNNVFSTSCWDTFNNLSRSVSQETDASMSDNIIDSIVNSSDLNLLGSVCKDMNQIDMCETDVKELKIISPQDFKNFVAKDLDSMVDHRTKWLESVDDLNSLLDDILQSYEDNDVNSMDCY